MKNFICTAFILVAVAFLPCGALSDNSKSLPVIEPNDEGLYVQPWFQETFKDIREDMEDAASEGKQLVILFEQKGCPYCKEIHHVNLRVPEVSDYIKTHFHVVQMNLWGDKEAIDLDGEVLTEKTLGRKWRVQFTPTIVFLPANIPDKPVSGRLAQVWTLLGYWKPFHFKHSFQYVREKGYESHPNFQRWLQMKAEVYEKDGKKFSIW